ncbi:MAG TPA: ribosome maturation factor RimM [Mesorhizobium sp.]|nr:ribosome maturation factor RimM [Mesorhizobium sp.]
MSKAPKLVELARLGAAQGLKGEIRARSFCADPLALGSYGPLQTEDGRHLEVVSVRPIGPPEKGVVAVRLKGVSDRTAAEALNGLALFVARDALPPPEDEEDFYHADLLGLAVRDGEGREIGRVTALHDFGAGDVLEVALRAGAAALIPFTRAAVPEVSVSGGFLRVDPIAAGLADAPGEADGGEKDGPA